MSRCRPVRLLQHQRPLEASSRLASIWQTELLIRILLPTKVLRCHDLARIPVRLHQEGQVWKTREGSEQ